MLLSLSINHIILFEQCTLAFDRGFHVFSGESGSGKTGIVQALHLLLGTRGDKELIRKGENRGLIEGIFQLESESPMISQLEKIGIFLKEDNQLIVKRMIDQEGRSKAWINHQQITLKELKELLSPLVLIIGQNASRHLLQRSYQLEMLDAFALTKNILAEHTHFWKTNEDLTKEINNIRFALNEVDLKKKQAALELEAIEIVSPAEGEDELLYLEYVALSQVDQKKNTLKKIETALNEASQTLRQCPLIDDQHIAHPLKTIQIEIVDLINEVATLSARQIANPERAELLSQRLHEIEHLKKRFGGSLEEVFKKKIVCENILASSTAFNEQLDLLESKKETIKEKIEQLATSLTHQRIAMGQILSEKMTKMLQELNLPDAIFKVSVTPAPHGPRGKDQILFLFTPNPGEREKGIEECASGGELSRILLSLQTLISTSPILLFDEIDGNIGGHTASIIGNVLKTLGQNQQIFAISHFPQLAKLADHHYKVEKQVLNGRTFSEVVRLETHLRSQELARMVGA